jgi:hypothetical protein
MKKDTKPRNVVYRVHISCESDNEAAFQCKAFGLKESSIRYEIDHTILDYGYWEGPDDIEIALRRFAKEKYPSYLLHRVNAYKDCVVGVINKKTNLYSESGELWTTINETFRIRMDP